MTMPRFDMEQFLTILQKYGVTYAFLVPPIVLGLAKHPLVAQVRPVEAARRSSPARRR